MVKTCEAILWASSNGKSCDAEAAVTADGKSYCKKHDPYRKVRNKPVEKFWYADFIYRGNKKRFVCIELSLVRYYSGYMHKFTLAPGATELQREVFEHGYMTAERLHPTRKKALAHSYRRYREHVQSARVALKLDEQALAAVMKEMRRAER